MKKVIAANKAAVREASSRTATKLQQMDENIGRKLKGLEQKVVSFEAEQKEVRAKNAALDSKVEKQAKAHEELRGTVEELRKAVQEMQTKGLAATPTDAKGRSFIEVVKALEEEQQNQKKVETRQRSGKWKQNCRRKH